MKHLIKNNQIVKSGIPSHFTRDNGELFLGGYENRTDIHYEDGWRDEIIPEFNNNTHTLGEVYYDIEKDVVTYIIVEKSYPPVEESKKRHYRDLEEVTNEVSVLFSTIKNIYDPLRDNSNNIPAGVKELVPMLQPLRNRAKQEIEALTDPKEAYEYKIKGSEIIGYINLLKKFL